MCRTAAAGEPEAAWVIRASAEALVYMRERGKDTDQSLYSELRILDEISRGATTRMEIEFIFQTSKRKIQNWGVGGWS